MSAAHLQFQHVSSAYSSSKEVLHDLNFSIHHRERVALVGRNGAGKSTLLLHCNGLLSPSTGQISVQGIVLSRHTIGWIRQQVGFVFQDADNQLFMPTVAEDVAFGPANMGLRGEQITERVQRALAQVHATHLCHKKPYQLSGGEKKRVSIATVLAMHPSILVMDEPSANLDPEARHQLITLLRSLRQTMLIATHDIGLIRALCPRTIVLCAGRIIADRATELIFKDHDLLQTAGLEAIVHREDSF